MRTVQSLRLLRTVLKPRSTLPRPYRFPSPTQACRHFQSFAALQRIETHKLSDIGEGVKEVQIIQWFVEEGAAVEEWSPLCEVQSDKASVEITSKYTGVVKKIHFEQDAIVQVGDGMLDIEVEGEAGAEEAQADEGEQPAETKQSTPKEGQEEISAEGEAAMQEPELSTKQEAEPPKEESQPQKAEKKGGSAGLATPAVRGMLKSHGLDISEIDGTGKDGRVLKEDVLKHIEGGQKSAASQPTQPAQAPSTPVSKPELDAKQVETTQKLTAIQSAMFKSMTKSLSIPHFLYSDSTDITLLDVMRNRLNATRNTETTPKYSYLPFIIKAVSLALNQYPILNARLDLSDSSKPQLVMRSNHNIGIAMDTPAGLLVPVVKNVNARSITSIAQELQRLSQLGQAGKLSNNDLSGGTITVSNIGSIGGEVVGPVVVEGQLAIMGVGKVKPTPVFGADGVTVQRADLMSTSWSADHRVIDGATMARMARAVQSYLQEPEKMLVDMS